MNELQTLLPSPSRLHRGGRQSGSASRIDRRTVMPDAWSTNEPDLMSDRLRAAVMELVEALRDEIAVEAARPSEKEPDRLLSIAEAARALGIGRSALYSEISARRIRSVKVGRRRLVPSSAISEVASGRS